MKNNQRGSITVVVFAIVAVLALGGGYLYVSSKAEKDRTKEALIQDIKGKIATAQAKVDAEASKLVYLSGVFRDQNPIYALVHDHYQAVSDAINAVDPLFNNAKSTKPEIKLQTTAAIKKDINLKKAQMNVMLAQWQKMANAALAQDTSKNTVQNIQKDAQAVQSFIEDLNEIVSGLTPENSGLTQAEIDAYAASVAQALLDITNALNALNQSVAVLPPISTLPIVVLSAVTDQQTVVDNAQAELDALEQELIEAETPEEEDTPSQTPDLTLPDDTTGDPSLSDPGTGGGGSQFPDIIVQPGDPELLQGENSF